MARKPFPIYDGSRIYKVDEEEEPYNVEDHREIYTVQKYSYHECLIDDVTNEGMGGVSLWDGERYFAEIIFIKPDQPHRALHYNTRYDYDFIEGNIDNSHRDAIIDLLRNEGPVYLLVFHDGTPERVINWAWIGTLGCAPEEVGEGEG